MWAVGWLCWLMGCGTGEQKPRSVIAQQARRATEVNVQSHVSGDQPSAAAPSTAEMDQALALAALGYIDEGDVVEEGHPTGVVEADTQRVSAGVNVYTLGGQSGAVAVDMDGTVVHRWDFSIGDAWPSFQHPEVNTENVPWRRVSVLDNGDLIGVWSGYGIVRITAASELVWGHWLPVHHDLHVFDDGRVLTLSTAFFERPDLHPGTLAVDSLQWLSADGFPTHSISLLDAFEKYSGWDDIWQNRPVKDNDDIFHTNTVYVLERDYQSVHPAFRKGRVLTSMRHLNAIALVDPETSSVVWAHQGTFARQHDPQMAPDGSIWVFDNQGAANTSRMLRLDPSTGDILSQWRGSTAHSFYTRTCGHAQQLGNGNLLVVSAEQGKVMEVSPDQQVVWSYHAPATLTGRDGQQRVARFFSFERLSPAEQLPWLQPPVLPGMEPETTTQAVP